MRRERIFRVWFGLLATGGIIATAFQNCAPAANESLTTSVGTGNVIIVPTTPLNPFGQTENDHTGIDTGGQGPGGVGFELCLRNRPPAGNISANSTFVDRTRIIAVHGPITSAADCPSFPAPFAGNVFRPPVTTDPGYAADITRLHNYLDALQTAADRTLRRSGAELSAIQSCGLNAMDTWAGSGVLDETNGNGTRVYSSGSAENERIYAAARLMSSYTRFASGADTAQKVRIRAWLQNILKAAKDYSYAQMLTDGAADAAKITHYTAWSAAASYQYALLGLDSANGAAHRAWGELFLTQFESKVGTDGYFSPATAWGGDSYVRLLKLAMPVALMSELGQLFAAGTGAWTAKRQLFLGFVLQSTLDPAYFASKVSDAQNFTGAKARTNSEKYLLAWIEITVSRFGGATALGLLKELRTTSILSNPYAGGSMSAAWGVAGCHLTVAAPL